MKIYDCFMFFDEDLVLDLRLNYLSKYVDKFVIVEAQYTHDGKTKKLNFDIWLDKKTSVIVKITYERIGNWEYRLKILE